MAKFKIQISEDDFLQKRFEVAKSVLESVVNKQILDSDSKQRENIYFNCVAFADGLLEELGYIIKPKEADREKSRVHNLSNILNNKDDD